MSDQPAGMKPAPKPGAPDSLFALPHSWKVAFWVALVMVLLALLGVGLTTTSKAIAPAYWIALVPIYGLLCIGTAWSRAGRGERIERAAVVRQTFHWIGIGVALGLDFLIRGTGEETGTAAGMNALLLLALGCYLAGVHLELLFMIVGVLLSLTLIVVAKAEQYLWLIFVVGGVVVLLLFGLQRFLLSGSRKTAAGPAHP